LLINISLGHHIEFGVFQNRPLAAFIQDIAEE